MDCRECAENLTAYLDGELSAAESERVRSHLFACASCAGEMDELRETARFIRTHRGDLEVRPEIWHSIRARISAPAKAPLPFRFPVPGRWRAAMAAVAASAVFVFGYMQYQHVQRRSLELYISRYMQERQAHRPSPAVFMDFRAGLHGGDSRPYNPFADSMDRVTDNPFRLEDR
jgi:anti-sigma factor RsiW